MSTVLDQEFNPFINKKREDKDADNATQNSTSESQMSETSC